MFLTSVIASLAAAAVGEAILLLRRRHRKRAPWEPSVHEMVSFRYSNWRLVHSCQADRTGIEKMFEEGGLAKIDSFIWNGLGKQAGVTPHDWNQWTINWQHGCIDKDGNRLGAHWSTHSADNEVMIYLYDAVPVVPPKPVPTPEPDTAPNLWTPLDDGQQILSYLRHPQAFWMEPKDYPWLRIYDDGTAVNSTHGASVRDYHVDFRFEPGKKRGYVIVTDDSFNGWKKKRYASMAAADEAIQAYFKLRREQDTPTAYVERAIVAIQDPNDFIDVSPMAIHYVDEKVKGNAFISYNIDRMSNGRQIYTIETSEGSRIFDRMQDAINFLYDEGYSTDEILEMSGGHRRFIKASAPAKDEEHHFDTAYRHWRITSAM